MKTTSDNSWGSRSRVTLAALVCAVIAAVIPVATAAPASADQGNLVWEGWCVRSIGYKAKVLGPHWSFAGNQVGYHNHVNLQIVHCGSEDPLRNWHFSKINRGGATCVHVWESRTQWERDIFCWPNNLRPSAASVAGAARVVASPGIEAALVAVAAVIMAPMVLAL